MDSLEAGLSGRTERLGRAEQSGRLTSPAALSLALALVVGVASSSSLACGGIVGPADDAPDGSVAGSTISSGATDDAGAGTPPGSVPLPVTTPIATPVDASSPPIAFLDSGSTAASAMWIVPDGDAGASFVAPSCNACTQDWATLRCSGTGFLGSLDDDCIDDHGVDGAGDSLEIYCQSGLPRFCLTYEACPWRNGGTSAEDVTCSNAGLEGTSDLADGTGGCGAAFCCSSTGAISYSGCN